MVALAATLDAVIVIARTPSVWVVSSPIVSVTRYGISCVACVALMRARNSKVPVAALVIVAVPKLVDTVVAGVAGVPSRKEKERVPVVSAGATSV